MSSYDPAGPSNYVCPHCDGSGRVVDDAYEPGVGWVATEFDCDRCDGTGVTLVDPDGTCHCFDCAELPRADRFVLDPLPVTW